MFKRLISRLSPTHIVAAALLAIGLIGAADWLTGDQLSLSILYIGPVALATWYAGKRAGLVTVLISTFTWLAADLSIELSRASGLVLAWNALMRFGVLFITATLLDSLRGHLQNERRLARTDVLTGVSNRRTFMEQLEYGLALAGREGKPLTVAFMDLDDFKRINDTQGHAQGDKVLRAIATALKDAVRRTDVVARMGGDEFAFLLPDTDTGGAGRMLAKVSSMLDALVSSKPAMPTCSIGAVTFLSPPRSAEEAMKFADRLMYDAKARGKSGVATQAIDPRFEGIIPFDNDRVDIQTRDYRSRSRA